MSKKILSKVIEKIKIPKKDSLDIPRRNMPQIKNKHMDKFRDWIEDEGIKTKEIDVPIKDLKPTQKDFNTKKVMDLMNQDSDKLKKLLLVSNDNYILDGHHKWLAHLNMGNKNIRVLQVDLPAKEFLAKAKEFPKVRYKDINDNMYKDTDPKLKYADLDRKIMYSKVAFKLNIAATLNLIETKDLDLIKEMAKSKSYDAHIDIARNKNTPVEVLWSLVKSKEDDVRLMVISNPNITPQILSDLSKDKSMEVREEVAKHPKTSDQALKVLTMDSSGRVRSEAEKRLKKVA